MLSISDKFFSKWVFCISIAGVASCSNAAVLVDNMSNFSQTVLQSSWYAPNGLDGDTYLWDNFQVQYNSSVNEVWWVGSPATSVTGFTIRFYTGLASSPDYQPTITALPESETSANYLKGYRFNNTCNETAIPGSSLKQFHAVLPTTMDLPGPAVYWIKIHANCSSGTWGIAQATHGRGNGHFRFITGFIFQTISGNLAFQLLGTSAAPMTIAGNIDLQNTVGSSGTESIGWTLSNGTNTYTGSVSVADVGNSGYNLTVPSGAPNGSYTLRFKGGTFLSDTLNVTLAGSSISGQNVSLVNGDVDQDGEVGSTDFDAVVGQFGNAGSADCDNDGEVGASDFDIVVMNFGLMDN